MASTSSGKQHLAFRILVVFLTLQLSPMTPVLRFGMPLIMFLSLSASAQKIDSLTAVADTAKNEFRVKALNELFRAYSQSDPVKAIGYTREALSYATEVGDQKGLAASYNNLGIAYRNQGAFDKALEYYIQSLKIYEKLDNKEGIATTKNNISTIYSIKRDFSQAMRYLEDSHQIFLNLNDSVRIIGSLNNLGNLHNEIQLYDKALSYYQEATKLSDAQGKKFADPLNNIGNIHFKQKNYQRAVEFYEKALDVERSQNNTVGILNVLTNLGITYAKAHQPKPAQAYLDEALQLCNQHQSFSFLPAIYKATAENMANQNNYKEAYEIQLKYDEAREKMFGEESSRNIAQMEILLAFQEKEKEFDVLKRDDEIKTLELKNTRLVVIVVIFAVLVTLGGLNYYYLGKKKILRRKKDA
jgi:tetratricopeptide (TPR) repeat protein